MQTDFEQEKQELGEQEEEKQTAAPEMEAEPAAAEEKKRGRFSSGVAAGIVLTLAVLAVAAAALVWTGRLSIERGGQADSGEEQFFLKKMLIDSYLENSFLYDYEEENLEDMMFKGLAAGLEDPYAAYYSAEEYEEMTKKSNGVYPGIGVLVQQDRRTMEITVEEVYEGGPAEEAGVQPGDQILRVEGQDVSEMELSDVVDMIQGETGTRVSIVFLRGEEELELSVERREVVTKDVKWEMLEDGVAYIQILRFDDVAEEQFAEALKWAEEQGAEKFLFDLRDNPGGNLDTVVEMLDLLLPEGVITYTENKQGERTQEFTSDAEHFVDQPMAVLVNGQSASAAEIFTGALKDYGMAKIVGTKTFGKGIVQTIFPLGDGSAIKMTTAKYFTPSGVCIQGTGIEPDVEIEANETLNADEEIPHEEDNQLQKALEVLREE